MASEATTDERRQAPRFGCAGDAEIVLPGRGMRYPGRLVDLSIGGCFVETACRLERGTMVEVWMNPDGQPLRLAANLLVKRPEGVGCRFIGVTDRKQEQIRLLILELEEEARRKTAPEERSLIPHEASDEASCKAPAAQAVPSASRMRGRFAGFLSWLRRQRAGTPA